MDQSTDNTTFKVTRPRLEIDKQITVAHVLKEIDSPKGNTDLGINPIKIQLHAANVASYTGKILVL